MLIHKAWIFFAAKPLRWILLLALIVRLAGLALFPHYFDLGREQGIITHDIYARNLLETAEALASLCRLW